MGWPPGSLHRQAFPVQAMSSGQYCLSVRPSVCLPTGERHQLASKDDCEALLALNIDRIITKPMTATMIAINYPLQQSVDCHFLQPLRLALYLRSKGISLSVSLSLTHTQAHTHAPVVRQSAPRWMTFIHFMYPGFCWLSCLSSCSKET